MSDIREVLTDVWATAASEPTIDCGPTKECRNMGGVTFDGFGPEGMDLRTAWRNRLATEGKLVSGPGVVRELVLGEGTPIDAAGPLGTH